LSNNSKTHAIFINKLNLLIWKGFSDGR